MNACSAACRSRKLRRRSQRLVPGTRVQSKWAAFVRFCTREPPEGGRVARGGDVSGRHSVVLAGTARRNDRHHEITDRIPSSVGAVRPKQGKTLAVMQVGGGSQSFNAVNRMRML